MRILLDTFVFVWLTSQPLLLSSRAREVLSDEENEFYYSDASVLELSMMYSDGMLEMPKTPRQWVNEQIKTWNVKSLGITREICYRLAETPAYHPDVYDRILVSTVLTEDLYLMTTDEEMRKYPISIIW